MVEISKASVNGLVGHIKRIEYPKHKLLLLTTTLSDDLDDFRKTANKFKKHITALKKKGHITPEASEELFSEINGLNKRTTNIVKITAKTVLECNDNITYHQIKCLKNLKQLPELDFNKLTQRLDGELISLENNYLSGFVPADSLKKSKDKLTKKYGEE